MQTEAIQAFSVNTLIGRGIREKNDLSATSRFHVRAAVGSVHARRNWPKTAHTSLWLMELAEPWI